MRPPLRRILQTSAAFAGALTLVLAGASAVGATEGDPAKGRDNGAVEGKSASESSAQDKAAQDKAAKDKAAQDKAAKDKAAQDKAAQDKAAKGDRGDAGKDAVVNASLSCAGDLTVTSTKDLSNIVVLLSGGTEVKFDNLSGTSRTFSAAQLGGDVEGVWIKSGNNHDGTNSNKGTGTFVQPTVEETCTPSSGTGDTPNPTPGTGGDDDDVKGTGKVTICHATGSATNPFVLITVSESAILKGGHGDHEDDIIPPFEGFDGQNLDQIGLIDDDCVLGGTNPGGTNPGGTNPGGTNPGGTNPGGTNPGNGLAPTPGAEVGNEVDSPEFVQVEDDVVLNPVTPLTPVTPAVPATPAVLPATPASPARGAVLTSTGSPAPQVLGAQVTRTGALAATGDGTTGLVPFGLGLLLLGFGIQRTSKRLVAARVG